jgi:hypothetical protein
MRNFKGEREINRKGEKGAQRIHEAPIFSSFRALVVLFVREVRGYPPVFVRWFGIKFLLGFFKLGIAISGTGY